MSLPATRPLSVSVSRPLLVTADGESLDDLLRLAATAGVEVDVAGDVGSARRYWASASLIVVGADLVERCTHGRLGRRPKIVLLGDDLDDGGVWQRAVELGAEQVVFLPDGEGWLVAALADAVEGDGEEAPLIAVIGGRGGAGATSLACALALTAARRDLQTVLVDADPLGGGIDLVFGAELADGLRWPDLAATRGRLPGQALTDALPRFEGLSVLSWDRGDLGPIPVEAVRAVLQAARRTSDLVVVDVPRGFDDVTAEVLASATSTLLLVPLEVRATAAAGRVAARADLLCRDLRLVVRGPAPVGLAGSDVAGALGLPLAGSLRAEPGLDACLDRGEPPAGRSRSPLAQLSHELLDGWFSAGVRRSA